MTPLQQWTCDNCGELIKRVQDGYVEWFLDGANKNCGFRIVHHAPASPRKRDGGDCYAYTKHPGRLDLALDHFVGPLGVLMMISLIDVGPLLEPNFRGPWVSDLREWVELFRRLHLPDYEEARRHWSDAQAEGFFDGANEISPYMPESLRAVVERYAK